MTMIARSMILISMVILMACVLASSVASADCSWRDGKYELGLGLAAHNKGPLASETEDGPDINLSLRRQIRAFGSWCALAHGGLMINLADGTSYGYAGADFEYSFGRAWRLGLGGGLAVHDGPLTSSSDSQRAYGSRLLLRSEMRLGYQFTERTMLEFVFDHISNGGFKGDRNQGLDTLGLRLGYRL